MIEFITSNVVFDDTARRRPILRVITYVSLCIFLVVFGLGACALAQLYAGTVTGVVSDQTAP